MDWISEARRLRADNKSLSKIAKLVGKSKTAVAKVCEGMEYDRVPWRDDARRMRAEGASIKEIIVAVGRSHAQVSQVVKDVVCPVNHQKKAAETRPRKERAPREKKPRPPRVYKPRPPKEKKPRLPPAWHAQARELAMQGKSYIEIMAAVGKSRSIVIEVCKDVYCYTPPPRERKPPKPRVRKPRAYKPKMRTPEKIRADKTKAKFKLMLSKDRLNREPAPITLPKISFMERDLSF